MNKYKSQLQRSSYLESFTATREIFSSRVKYVTYKILFILMENKKIWVWKQETITCIKEMASAADSLTG